MLVLEQRHLCDNKDHPNMGLEVAHLITCLPARFDHIKESYNYNQSCFTKYDTDEFWEFEAI